MRAQYPDHCIRCNGDIFPEDEIVRRGDGFLHLGCAPGADDE